MLNNIFSKSPVLFQSRRCSGFTILEILTAVVILTIVVSLVVASFNSVFSSADRVSISSDLYEMGTACLVRITNDLQNIHVSLYPRYQPPGLDSPQEIYRLVGSQENVGGEIISKLRFTSLAHLPPHHEGVAEVVYYAQETETNGIVIKRADTLFPYPDFEESATDPVMCEQVRAFKIVYFHHDGQEFQEWNSEDEDFEYSTPLSVGITLLVGNEEIQHEFSTEIALPMNRYQTIKR